MAEKAFSTNCRSESSGRDIAVVATFRKSGDNVFVSNPSRTVDHLTLAQDEIAFAVRILVHPEPLDALDRAALREAFRQAIHALVAAARLT